MIQKLIQNNPHIKIYPVTDPEFARYGKVLKLRGTPELLSAADGIPLPSESSVYTASEQSFESLPIAKELCDEYFGEADIQLGYCCGHSDRLNAAEWHLSSEINVAVTDLVLFLGDRRDLERGKLDATDFKAFYLPRGTAVEVYAGTLHFCPCEIQKSGFGCVVVLPRGTNTPLGKEHADKRLFRKNKWIVAHVDNASLIARGVIPMITGDNTQIRSI